MLTTPTPVLAALAGFAWAPAAAGIGAAAAPLLLRGRRGPGPVLAAAPVATSVATLVSAARRDAAREPQPGVLDDVLVPTLVLSSSACWSCRCRPRSRPARTTSAAPLALVTGVLSVLGSLGLAVGAAAVTLG